MNRYSRPPHLLKDLQEIEELKEGNRVFSLTARLVEDSRENKETREVIWRILSHPYSKIRSLRVEACFMYSDQVEELLERWVIEVPVKAPRTLELAFEREPPREQIEEHSLLMWRVVRKALELPKNGIEELVIIDPVFSTQSCLPRGMLLLRPVLENPNNGLRKLDLKSMRFAGLKDVNGFLLGLASPSCKVTEIDMHGRSGLDQDGIYMLVDGLHTLDRIEKLRLSAMFSGTWLTDDNRAILANRLACVLQRPGNRIRSLDISWNELRVEHIRILAEALKCEQCRLEQLFLDYICESTGLGAGVGQAIAIALQHSNCRLKLFKAEGVPCVSDGYRAFGESLRSISCKLESLTIGRAGGHAGTEAEAIAEALQTFVPNQLRQLMLPEFQPPMVFDAFAKSLLSRHNKLRLLELRCVRQLDNATSSKFYRAARVSTVIGLMTNLDHPFVRAFNKPFLQVFYTLLSIKSIPRLGWKAWVRLLPMQDFIRRIAEVLDWPLGDLSVPLVEN